MEIYVRPVIKRRLPILGLLGGFSSSSQKEVIFSPKIYLFEISKGALENTEFFVASDVFKK
jgi:hypothetical protein